jgi:hypothetical protein
MFAFPNPYKKEVFLNVQGNLSNILNIKIFDVTGKLIDAFEYKNTGSNRSVNIEWNADLRGKQVHSGLYFVEVTSDENVVRTKLIKY